MSHTSRRRVFVTVGDNHPLKRGFCDYAREHGPWQVVFRDTQSPRRFLDFQALGFDGAITAIQETTYDPAAYRDLHIPVVNTTELSRFVGVPTVCVDSFTAARLAAEHLLGRGLRHFGYFGHPSDELPVVARRRDTFRATVAAAGFACAAFEPARLWHHERLEEVVVETARWLAALPRPCGVLAFADAHAQFVLEAARRVGLRVPQQVAVMGIDNNELNCEFAVPQLTSVDPDFRAVGYRAAALLDEMMAGRRPDPPRETRVPVRGLVQRASTDVLPHGDDDVAAAYRHIHERALRGVRVDEVVAAVGVSRSALVAKFTQLVGRSPKAEITLVKVDRARALLAETDWPVFRVARETGFASDAHFCRVFKAETGETPQAFRSRTRARVRAGIE